jgi:hypothetical protein
MNFTYLSLAHENHHRVLRLAKALTTDDTYFDIHVDNKIDELLFKSVIKDHVNVSFCEHREIVNPEGFSVTETIMESIKDVFRCNILKMYNSIINNGRHR